MRQQRGDTLALQLASEGQLDQQRNGPLLLTHTRDTTQRIDHTGQIPHLQQARIVRCAQIDGDKSGDGSESLESIAQVRSDAFWERRKLAAKICTHHAAPMRIKHRYSGCKKIRTRIVIGFRARGHGAGFDKRKAGANRVGQPGTPAIRACTQTQDVTTCSSEQALLNHGVSENRS